MTPLGEEGFQAYVENGDQTDSFWLEEGALFHSATVKYVDRTSIQPKIFSCALLVRKSQ